MSSAASNLCNFAAYQLAWFAVILGVANGYAWAGAALALLVAGIHLWKRRDALEIKLVCLATVLGFLIDSTLALAGQVHFAAHWPASVTPYWMLSLWIAFATTLNHSLGWLTRRPVAAALAGAVGGPLAYLAGEKLGALELSHPAVSLPLIGLLWLLAMVTFSLTLLRADLAPQVRRVPA